MVDAFLIKPENPPPRGLLGAVVDAGLEGGLLSLDSAINRGDPIPTSVSSSSVPLIACLPTVQGKE